MGFTGPECKLHSSRVLKHQWFTLWLVIKKHANFSVLPGLPNSVGLLSRDQLNFTYHLMATNVKTINFTLVKIQALDAQSLDTKLSILPLPKSSCRTLYSYLITNL